MTRRVEAGTYKVASALSGSWMRSGALLPRLIPERQRRAFLVPVGGLKVEGLAAYLRLLLLTRTEQSDGGKPSWSNRITNGDSTA